MINMEAMGGRDGNTKHFLINTPLGSEEQLKRKNDEPSRAKVGRGQVTTINSSSDVNH